MLTLQRTQSHPDAAAGLFRDYAATALGRSDRAADPRATRHLARAIAVAAIALIAGCTTVPLKQAEGIGTSGRAYAQAVRAVGEFALSDVLDYEVEQLAIERAGFPTTAERQKLLKGENDALKQRIQLVETSLLQVALVEEYFAALEVLAKYDVGTPATAATGSLLDSFDAVEVAIEKSSDAAPSGGLRKLTPEERSAAAKLVGLVAQAAHARQVSARLESDAPTIGRHLRLLTLELTAMSGWVASRQENRETTFFALEIQKPFVAEGLTNLPPDWQDKYKRYLRGVTINERLKQGAEAGRAMERTWERYLAGAQTPEEFQQNVKDMQQLVQAVAALKAARAAARASEQKQP